MAIKNLPVRTLGRFTNPQFLTSSAPTPLEQRLTNGTLASGDQIEVPNDEKTYLHVRNGAGPAQVVIDRVITVDGAEVPDRTHIVPANSDRIIGDFPRQFYGDTLRFAIADVTNVSLAILRLP